MLDGFTNQLLVQPAPTKKDEYRVQTSLVVTVLSRYWTLVLLSYDGRARTIERIPSPQVIGIQLPPIALRELHRDKYATPFLPTLFRIPTLEEREHKSSSISAFYNCIG